MTLVQAPLMWSQWPPPDAAAGKPAYCKGPDFMSPEVPPNAVGTLGDLLQAGRTRLWTGGASGPADVAQWQSISLPS